MFLQAAHTVLVNMTVVLRFLPEEHIGIYLFSELWLSSSLTVQHDIVGCNLAPCWRHPPRLSENISPKVWPVFLVHGHGMRRPIVTLEPFIKYLMLGSFGKTSIRLHVKLWPVYE